MPTLENSKGTMPQWSLRPHREKARHLGIFSLKMTDEEIAQDIFAMTNELPRGHPTTIAFFSYAGKISFPMWTNHPPRIEQLR
jgi:hypothetical protein